MNIVFSCLGFGFATTFWQAMVFRTMGGALNGNIGVLRTMVSEIVQEKKWVISRYIWANITNKFLDINPEPSCFSLCVSI